MLTVWCVLLIGTTASCTPEKSTSIKPPKTAEQKEATTVATAVAAAAVATAVARENARIQALVLQGQNRRRRGSAGIAVGVGHTCTLHSRGDVYCWGGNLVGESGIKPDTALPCEISSSDDKETCLFSVPTRPVRLSQLAQSVSAGISHTCALLDDGVVQCWGDNSFGQLGLASGTECEDPSHCSQPITISLEDKATEISAAGAHTCALLDNGTIQCWGDNRYGQLGVHPSRRISHLVVLSAPALSIATGQGFSCAMLLHSIHCWGRNAEGQLGRNYISKTGSPAPIQWYKPPGALLAGGQHACLISEAKEIHCWGDNSYGQLGIYEPPPSNCSNSICARPTAAVASRTFVTKAIAGNNYTCILATLELDCWGENNSGQLGVNNTTNIRRPAQHVILPEIIAAADASHHTCLMSRQNNVFCWGENSSKQLGLGLNTPSFIPKPSDSVKFPPLFHND